MGEQSDIVEFLPDDEMEAEPEDIRLKHLARINPTKSEVSHLDPDTQVSFVALEDFGTDGEIKQTETRELGDVYDGYTYFREGDIAIAKITPSFENGKGAICCGLTNDIGFGTTELHVLRPRDGVSTEYLWYVLRSKPFIDEAETAMRGVAGQQRVPTEFLENFKISNRDYETQSKISVFLRDNIPRYSEIIDMKQDLLEKLDERKSRTITKSVTSGVNLPKNTVEPNSEFFDEIPSDWEIVRLKFVLDEIEQGWSPRCKEKPANKDQWGVLKAGAVNGGVFDPSENKTLPPDIQPREQFRIRQGDVLMNRASGSRELLGSTALVSSPCQKLLLCDKIYRLHPREDKVISNFLPLALQSHQSRVQIQRMVSGADGLANNIPQGDLKNLEIALPPKSEQATIAEQTQSKRRNIRDIVRLTEKSIKQLQNKRQALITAAVTGQIDVSDV